MGSRAVTAGPLSGNFCLSPVSTSGPRLHGAPLERRTSPHIVHGWCPSSYRLPHDLILGITASEKFWAETP